ncbi:MAG: hypothetical protein IKY83_02070, partial [Proteobacteria bacterium]|nr:hypothetical protein [Pseudomonadota bacterium]
MKNLLVKASILAILCSMIGCADRDDEASSSDCDVNVCKDANTMTFCNEGTPMDVPCTLGCDEAKGECKTAEPACVADVCNGNDLIQCINGVQTPVTCPNGCENGACRPATGGSCTINICKDANVLLACVSGVQQETDCPFGCEAGACKEKCTGNYCKDAGTLVSCDENGVSTVKTCANGCDAGACLDACESNFCRDASNLMVCTDGKLSIVNCPYGCDAGACKTSVVTDCTNGDKKCLDDSMLQVCMNGQWVNGRTCDNGCVNNDCVGQDDECENGAKECADNAARTCVAGVWVVSQCTNGCEDGVCVAPPVTECTDGSKKCDGKNVMNCVDGKWVAGDACDDICLNGACASTADLPKVGDKCDDSFVELCAENAGYYCYEGEVANFECDSDAPCAVRASDNYSDCAVTCNAGDAAQNVCMTYMGYPLAVTYTCDKTEDGGYGYFMGDYEFCESSCSEGVCDGQTPTTCTEGAKQCSGKNVQTCTNGKWVTSDTCEISCKNGACSSDPVVTPTVGDKCDDNFVELCDGNTGYYCYEGEVASIECDNDAPCAVRAADNYSDCAETCNAGDAAQNVCMSYMGYPLAVTYTCDKTEAGGYALFMGDYEFCESSCSDGVCDGQTPTTCTEGAKQCS